ncbi:hypothetical protein F2P81_010031 [Scophthalmus maximus]|uniref:Uncharacterized protein n=1 Tax=Scophthalmus maximus TaxID=52904 RepID=A0A6A4SUM0_SCOMX|nr:hypothetical protein F2P81_010031 [Scophthalmus maximus]
MSESSKSSKFTASCRGNKPQSRGFPCCRRPGCGCLDDDTVCIQGTPGSLSSRSRELKALGAVSSGKQFGHKKNSFNTRQNSRGSAATDALDRRSSCGSSERRRRRPRAPTVVGLLKRREKRKEKSDDDDDGDTVRCSRRQARRERILGLRVNEL